MKTIFLRKRFSFVAGMMAILAILSFSSCDPGSGGPGDDSSGDTGFIDQNLQGKINGKTYAFVSGEVEESPFNPGSLDFDLYNIPRDDTLPFGYPFGGYLKVMFNVPAQVGKTSLFWNLSTGENETLTLYDPDAGSYNHIVTEGSIEILTLTDTEITGRIWANGDTENTVNGNFTVPRVQ